MRADNGYLEIKKALDGASRVMLTSHVAPDGDNIGSMLGLGISLQSMGKEVVWYLEDKVPQDYLFLPKASAIQQYCGEDLSNLKLDLVICLDTSAKDRIGEKLYGQIMRLDVPVVNIDHHATNEGFGDVTLVVSDAAATGEIVFDLLDSLQLPMNKDIATALYVALTTDTGGFQYDNVTPHTFRVAATLVEHGAMVGQINVFLYQKKSVERQLLHNLAMETLRFYENQKIGIIHTTRKMLEDTGTLSEDTEGLIEQVRALAPVEIAVLLKEKNAEVWKISLRSKTDANVSQVAQKFGGGGHVKAAGCTIYGSFSEVLDRLLCAIREALYA